MLSDLGRLLERNSARDLACLCISPKSRSRKTYSKKEQSVRSGMGTRIPVENEERLTKMSVGSSDVSSKRIALRSEVEWSVDEEECKHTSNRSNAHCSTSSSLSMA